jgi:hypothetical protein
MIQFADETLDRIGDEIAELSAHLDAATHRLLVLLRDFDAADGWTGFRSCAHWLSWRTGIELGAAREKVRVARALGGLPQISEALRRGEVSYAKVRAMSRVATPGTEEQLLELARDGTAAHMEKVVRAWRRVNRLEEAEREGERNDRRTLSLYIDDDGSYVIRGRLNPEIGALLEQALQKAMDALENDGTAGQRRADALGLVAELALASRSARVSGSRAGRYEVTLHVDAEALSADGDAGMCELESGVRVSAETSRRISCDASLVVMTHAANGDLLSVGRRRRTIPPSLRRALQRRDGGCRFPGCGLRFCDAHHVVHWSDGGPTSMENLVLLCRFHHRLLHEEGYSMELSPAGVVAVRAPAGWIIPEVPEPAPVPARAAEALRAQHRAMGLDIHPDIQGIWDGRRMDLGRTICAFLANEPMQHHS